MLAQFYGDILPSEGYYCLFLAATKSHVWAESIDELVEMTEERMDEQGVYFGTAAFKSVANRKQTNVLSLKALRLDIDAGAKKHERDPEGTYPSQPDALKALVTFVASTGLRPSYIVSSGEGLHVYYCLTEAIDEATWLPLAKGLGQLAMDRGLLVDSSVTTDSARILRPIGTLHSNGKRVATLRRTGVVFGVQNFREQLPAATVAHTRTFDNAAINDELSLGYEGPPSSAFKIAQHCGALREVAVAKGDVPEPHWRAMLGLVKRTVEGIDVAHEWSSGYDGYDYDETERKFDAWTTGPTTCTEFGKHSDACKTCQYAGKVKSPISLGLMTAPEIEELPEEKKPTPAAAPEPTGDPWDGVLPAKYAVKQVNDRNVLVYAMETEKTTDTGDVVPVVVHVPFTYDIFWFGRWAEADNSDDSAQVTLHLLSGGRVKTFLMDQTIVSSIPKLLEYLAGKAIHTTTHRKAGQAMLDYAKAQLNRIKDEFMQPKITDHLGLRVLDNGMLVCAQGPHVIYPDGSILEGMLGGNVRGVAEGMFLPIEPCKNGAWPSSVWDSDILPKAHRHARFLSKYYKRDGLEKYQLAIMLSLASPLMAFVEGNFTRGSRLPPKGLMVSLYSRETARGKTTAIKSALAAYGDPNALSRDSNATGSTALARIAKMSIHGTLPLGLDEMGDLPLTEVASLVSAVGNGSGRDRATKTGGLMASNGTWSLIATMAANKSAREMVSVVQKESDAIQFRMLELNVENVSEFDLETRSQHTTDWAEIRTTCAGALGGAIHRAICEMGVEGINKLVTACVAKAASLVNAGQSARFQYQGLGAVLALQIILNRRELAPFDTKTLVDTFKDAYANGLEFIEQKLLPTDGLSLLQRALNDLQPNTVITQTESRSGGFGAKFDEIMNVRVPDTVHARHIVSTNITYLSSAALREWCRSNGISDIDIVRTAKNEDVFKPMTKAGGITEAVNLLKGTKNSVDARCRAYRVDITRLNILTNTADPLTGSQSDNVVPFPEKAAPEPAKVETVAT